MKVFISIALVVTLALVHGQELEGPQVDTHYGKVKGTTALSRGDRMYYRFRGVPYGKAPVRFQNPEVPDNWEGVKDVSQPAPACIHYNPLQKTVVGQEDCLNLNIATPKLPVEGQDKILLPVVVYLHPGLNSFGFTEELEPKYSMDGDAVIVQVNWRQSVFGFLNTNDMYATGNQGLRDQVLALKWVQQNIEKFGGNKDSVTLFGSSTGGSDAILHTLSPQSKNLFHRVLAMGGSTLSRQSLVRNPVKHAKNLGLQVGCPIDSSSALVSCLKTKDAKEILDKMIKIDGNHNDLTVEQLEKKAFFGPTIDKIVSEGQTEQDLIIPDHPLKLLATEKVITKVPLIIGANEMGGVNPISAVILKEKSLMEKLDKQWNELAPLLFLYKDVATDKDAVSKKLRDYYFGDKVINEETFQNLSDIFLDRFVGFPLVSTAKLYSKVAPVYLYYFSHTPETNLLKFFGLKQNYGMANLDELQYLFKINIERIPYPEIKKDHGEYELSKNLIKLLGSFAETGKPTKTWGEGKEWKANEGGEVPNWYKIGPSTELGPPPEKFVKRIGVWKDLYEKELAKEKETPVVDTFTP